MISFFKMQATGNDFIIINCLTEKFNFSFSNLSQFLCNRKYGVGADGVIFVEKGKTTEYKMRIFNQDGTEAGMCGNGIRCLGKFLYENGLVCKDKFKIETLSGTKDIELSIENKTVTYVKVNMGNPSLEYSKIPVIFPNVIDKRIETLSIQIDNRKYIGFPISMGNPHFVIFENDLESINVEKIGSIIENYKYFPERTNVEFVKVIDKNKIKMRVWERGVGRTLGCGTGASAAAVISSLKNYTYSDVNVELEGGILRINYDKSQNKVILQGTADNVFAGKI